LIPYEQEKQLKLEIFPSELKEKSPKKNKKIVINRINSVKKYDEIALAVEFQLVPSKKEFSRLRSSLWFDGQEVKSAIVTIPQGFGDSDEFQLKLELDMRGISAGAHYVKIELQDLFSPCFAISQITIEYIPQDKKAKYRKIPIAKKLAGDDFAIISNSDKEIYLDINKKRKSELESKRDGW